MEWIYKNTYALCAVDLFFFTFAVIYAWRQCEAASCPANLRHTLCDNNNNNNNNVFTEINE